MRKVFRQGIYQKNKNPDEVMQQFREEKNTFFGVLVRNDFGGMGLSGTWNSGNGASNTFQGSLYAADWQRTSRRTNTKTNVKFVIDVEAG